MNWMLVVVRALGGVFCILLVSAVHAQGSVPGKASGEFSVSPSGAATYRIPISVPPGVAGVEPKLALVYNSQVGNGIMGVGWSLDGLSAITRCPKSMATDGVGGAVNFDANDQFCLDGQRLILVSGTHGLSGSEYRTELDGFNKITILEGSALGPKSFVVKMKSGLFAEYGVTADSRIEAVKLAGKSVGWPDGTVHTWAQNRFSDVKGNSVAISYVRDFSGGEYYVSRVDYAATDAKNKNSIVFLPSATPRLDVTTAYRLGSKYASNYRLGEVVAYQGSNPVRKYVMEYAAQSDVADRSRVVKVTECDGAAQCFPPTDFSYSSAGSGFQAKRWVTGAGGFWDAQRWYVADVDGDGLSELVNIFNDSGSVSIDVHVNRRTHFETQRWETRTVGYSDAQKWFMADVNGDGLTDAVNVFGDDGKSSIDVHLNRGGYFEAQRWESRAGGYWDTQRWFVADVNGDGLIDLVNVFGDSGATSIDVHMNMGGRFESQRWETRAGGFWDAQKWFVADVNGDGLADVINVFGEDGQLSIDVHLNRGGRFEAQRWETRTGGYWESQRWFVVDANGDGLADLVNVFSDSGEASIDVHLNMGGSFAMQRWETRAGGYWDAQKWFMADVNGDGLADAVNVFGDDGQTSVDVHLNRGGRFESQRWETRAGGFWDAQRWFVDDVNGDGVSDLVNVFSDSGNASADVHLSNSGVVDVVGMANGRRSVFIEYSAINNPYVYSGGAFSGYSYPVLDVKDARRVVNYVKESDGLNEGVVKRYKYAGLKFEHASSRYPGSGRGGMGFRFIKIIEENSGIQTYTEFSQRWPYIGQVLNTETRLLTDEGGGGRLLKSTENSLKCYQTEGSAGGVKPNSATAACGLMTEWRRPPIDSNCTRADNEPGGISKVGRAINICPWTPGQVYFPFVDGSRENSWDATGTQLPTLVTRFSYDGYADQSGVVRQFGDPTQITVDISDGGFLKQRKVTTNQYQPARTDGANWQSGRLNKAVVTSSQY